jgi:uncharacterized protein (DUF362 family)
MRPNNTVVWVETVDNIFCHQEIKHILASIMENFKAGMTLGPSSKVMIKLNLCLLKGFETGATVNPYVARALVEWLLENYDLEMIYLAEADATHLSADMAFKILGWHDLFKDLPKVRFLNLSQDDTTTVTTHYSKSLLMSKQMMEVECLISLAKLKTHTQQKITGIMKNQFGAIPYKYKITYHSNLAEYIYDATAVRKPDISIIDGLISMEGNGPTNGIPRRTKLILVSNDPLAIDHLSAKIMGFRPLSVPHLKLAYNNSLGRTDYLVCGNPPSPLNLKFKFLPKWKELIKKGIGLMQRESINEEA